MNEEVMLTTYDNPYSPFDEYSRWLEFDRNERHYNTQEFLARSIDRIENAEDFDDEVVEQIVIDDIVERNPFGVHIKITKEEADKLKKLRKTLNFSSKTTEK